MSVNMLFVKYRFRVSHICRIRPQNFEQSPCLLTNASHTIFHTQYVGMFTIHQIHTPSSDTYLSLSPETKENCRTAAMLLLYILQKLPR